MHATSALASAFLAILSQLASPPAPETAPPPVTTPAPGASTDPAATPPQAPATDPAATPPGLEVPAPAADAEPWHVERVDVPGTPPRSEVRVLRADGTAVTVGEGLSSIQQTTRLTTRAQAADTSENSTQAIIGRATILAAAGALTVVGLGVAAFGGGLWAYARAVQPSASDQLTSLAPTAPSILVTGLITALIGSFALIVGGGLWAWMLFRGAPPPDPAAVQALSAALAWDDAEAREVVEKHNTAAGLPPTTPGSEPPAPTEPTPPPALEGTPAPAPAEAAPPAAPSTTSPKP